MLPISKSKGRAVLSEAAAEEECVGEGGNFIMARHNQEAHRFFFLLFFCLTRREKGDLARDQNVSFHFGKQRVEKHYKVY